MRFWLNRFLRALVCSIGCVLVAGCTTVIVSDKPPPPPSASVEVLAEVELMQKGKTHPATLEYLGIVERYFEAIDRLREDR
jgi:hypothetical protein